MSSCSLIAELCTKEGNDKTGCNFNFGHQYIWHSFSYLLLKQIYPDLYFLITRSTGESRSKCGQTCIFEWSMRCEIWAAKSMSKASTTFFKKPDAVIEQYSLASTVVTCILFYDVEFCQSALNEYAFEYIFEFSFLKQFKIIPSKLVKKNKFSNISWFFVTFTIVFQSEILRLNFTFDWNNNYFKIITLKSCS